MKIIKVVIIAIAALVVAYVLAALAGCFVTLDMSMMDFRNWDGFVRAIFLLGVGVPVVCCTTAYYL